MSRGAGRPAPDGHPPGAPRAEGAPPGHTQPAGLVTLVGVAGPGGGPPFVPAHVEPGMAGLLGRVGVGRLR